MTLRFSHLVSGFKTEVVSLTHFGVALCHVDDTLYRNPFTQDLKETVSNIFAISFLNFIMQRSL